MNIEPTHSEGDPCRRLSVDPPGCICDGELILPDVENCSCHISPPCSACETNELVCSVCGEPPE